MTWGLPAAVVLLSGTVPAEEVRWVMGAPLSIEARHDSAAVVEEAREAAFARAQQLDNLLSNYLFYTPLSKLNAAAGTGPVDVTPELFAYLERARRDFQRTDGAFDVTVGALVAAHRSATGAAADAETVAAALAQAGMTRIGLTATDAGGRVELPAGFALDPGGDGKGVAVDAMVVELRLHGIRHALVNFGESSLYAMGSDNGDEPWRVAIRGLGGNGSDEILGAIRLENRALSVSSALPPSQDPEAPRRGHIVDPRTGELVHVQRTAVVVSPSATDAEVLSTALVVEGRPGERWQERFPGAEMAVFEAGAPAWMTPGFARLFEAADG